MKFLLCCTLVPAKYEVANKEISNAANRFLTNFCTKLMENHSLKILSYIGVKFDDESKAELIQQKSENIQYYFKSKRIIGGVLRMLRAIWGAMEGCEYAITYNTVYAWILTPLLTKIRHKKSILILADYSPIESYTGVKQRIYAKIQQYFIGKYDYVIGLSEHTRKYLKEGQRFQCMEGGIADEFYAYYDKYVPSVNECMTVMYSGILEKVTGIELLINAFEKIESSQIELIITGDGSLAEWVQKKDSESDRIHYLGCIPYEEYMKKLSEADVLVNPRNMVLPENKNNFPSKIMEYLATGKMIISTKFPGWERYQKYIDFCESNENDIRDAIERCIINKDSWKKVDYEKNRSFAREFLWETQVKKIEKLLEKSDEV